MIGGGEASVGGRPAAVDAARLALVEAGLLATVATVAFATSLVALQVAGRAEIDALGGCALLALACAGAWATRTRPTRATIGAGVLAGAAAAMAGTHDHLVFLPAVVLLIALTPIARPAALAAAVAAAAAGFLVPLSAMPAASLRLALVAAGVVTFPWIARIGAARLRHRGPGAKALKTSGVPPSAEAPLSARQLEVLALLGQGLRQREAAERLGLSVHQVGHLLRDAREKTGASTRELVARFAGRAG